MFQILRIALRNVLRNRRRTLISVFAIFIGIGVNVGIRGFMNGLQAAIVRNVVGARLGAIQMHKTGYVASVEGVPLNLDMPYDAAVLDRLRALPGVTGAAPRINFPVIVSKPAPIPPGMDFPPPGTKDETVFALGSAIDPTNEYVVCPEAPKHVEHGTPLGTEPGMLMTVQLADAIGAKLGDLITLLANDRDGALNGIELPLRGLYLSRIPGFEKTIVVTLPAAQTLLRMDGRITEIAVGVADAERVEEVASTVSGVAGADREVHTWRDLAKNMTDIMEFQNVFLSIASSVFVIISLTLIVNTMLMAVLERVREIGTMLAVGVRRRQILALFLTESAVLGVLGGVAGALAGWAVVMYLHWRGIDLGIPGVKASNILRPEIGLGYMATMVGISIVGAVVAAVYPAFSAARLRPVEALQHV